MGLTSLGTGGRSGGVVTVDHDTFIINSFVLFVCLFLFSFLLSFVFSCSMVVLVNFCFILFLHLFIYYSCIIFGH